MMIKRHNMVGLAGVEKNVFVPGIRNAIADYLTLEETRNFAQAIQKNK